MLATEQNPDRLGKTVEDLDISHAIGVYPKTLFSMVIPPVESYLKEAKEVNTVVLMGIEVSQISLLIPKSSHQKNFFIRLMFASNKLPWI